VDISDAFNILMYVGDYNAMYDTAEALLLRREERCFEKLIASFGREQRDRFRVGGERPGAIWHLFRPQDADKIREFLVAVSAGACGLNSEMCNCYY
jgi:lysine-specific demethylase 3